MLIRLALTIWAHRESNRVRIDNKDNKDNKEKPSEKVQSNFVEYNIKSKTTKKIQFVKVSPENRSAFWWSIYKRQLPDNAVMPITTNLKTNRAIYQAQTKLL